MTQKKKICTIDLTPTWASLMPTLMMGLTNGTAEGQKIATEELTRLARIADFHNELGPKLLASNCNALDSLLKLLAAIDSSPHKAHIVGQQVIDEANQRVARLREVIREARGQA